MQSRMKRSSLILQSLLTLSVCAGAAKQADAPLLPALSDVMPPASAGQVTKRFAVADAPVRNRMVLLIQDAHANYEAQKHIAEILEHFADDYKLRLILVEGGVGDVGLSDLRKWTGPATRQKLAEERLRSGEFAGHEYLDVAKDYPLILWGIEDQTLYDANVRYFLTVEKNRLSMADELREIKSRIDRAREAYPSPALEELLRKSARFEAGELKLSEYARFLTDAAQRAGVDLQGFPQLKTVTPTGEESDPETVSKEQQAAVAQLRAVADPAQMTALLETAKQLKAKEAQPIVFYRQFAEMLKANAIDIQAYPALAAYAARLNARANVQAAEIWKELIALQEMLRPKLAETPEAAAVDDLARRIERFEQLLSLKWLPGDFAAYKQDPASAGFQPVELDGLLPADQAARLNQAVTDAAPFYESVEARNAVLVRNSIAKMDVENQPIAALILGGFHTDAVAELFVKEGIQVAVITPGVGKDSAEDKYHFWLKLRAEP